MNPVEKLLADKGLTFDSVREAVAYDLNMKELGRFPVTAAEGYSTFNGEWSGVRLVLSDAVKQARQTFPGAVHFWYEGEIK